MPHPRLQLLLDPASESLTLIPSKDNKVVCVSHQPCVSPSCRSIRFIKNLVKPVQVEVGKQERNYTALRTALASVAPFLSTKTFPVRPLGSTGITPLPGHYGPVRLPARAAEGLCLSQRRCAWGRVLPGLPGSSANLSARAVPYHSGEPDSCIRPLLHYRHWASPILDGWPLP